MDYRLTDAPDLALTDAILTFAHGGKAGLRYFLLRLAKRRDTEPFFHATAWEEGKLCAYLLCQKKADGWCYGDLLVHPAFRQRGVGKELLARTAAEAEKRGATALYCYVAPGNTPSHRLQIAAGFARETGRAEPEAPGARYVLFLHPAAAPYTPSRPGIREERPSDENDAPFVRDLLAERGVTVSREEAKKLARQGVLTFTDGAPVAFHVTKECEP